MSLFFTCVSYTTHTSFFTFLSGAPFLGDAFLLDNALPLGDATLNKEKIKAEKPRQSFF